MAIITRGGDDANFDKNKMLAKEWAGVLDKRKVYYAFGPGDVKEMSTVEDMAENIQAINSDIIANLTIGAEAATQTFLSAKDGQIDTSVENFLIQKSSEIDSAKDAKIDDISVQFQEKYDGLETEYATQLTSVNTQLAHKANQADLNSTNASVVMKANQSALDTTNANVTNLSANKADKSEVANVMTPKGNIAYASLPITGNAVGWYYYCSDGDGTHGAGNYVWNGISWYFGGTGDQGYNLLKSGLDKYTVIDLGALQQGYYVSNTGALVPFTTENAYYSASDYINCENLNVILSNGCYDSSAGLAFFDKSQTFISWVTTSDLGVEHYITVPKNAKYFRVSEFYQTGAFTTKQKISVPCINNTKSINSTLKNYLTGYDIKTTGVSGFYANSGDKIFVNVTSNTATTNLYINIYQGEAYLAIPIGSGVYEFTAPKSGYVELQATGTAIVLSLSLKRADQRTYLKPVYVSQSGNDYNAGTYIKPFKTLTKALSVSDNILMFSGTYLITDDSINASDRNINIRGLQGNNVELKFGQSLNVTLNGSTGYYETAAYTFDSNTYKNYVLYVDGVPDAATEVISSEIHPRQAGHRYRLESTQLKTCLTLAELAGKTNGFYYDGTKFIIKTPLTISSVWLPSLKYIDLTRCNSEFTNINIKYSSLTIRLGVCKMTDCRILFPTSAVVGGIAYLTANIELIRCEICGMNKANSLNSDNDGDGVCGILQHTDYLRNELSATLIDCWVHDNQDDGFSDHGQGCNTVMGGLYEHNRKAGIIPASGVNSTVIGATSRGQQYGYATTNDLLNGNSDDLYMGIELVNCLANDNSIANYACLNDVSAVICRNCQSEDSAIGYSNNTSSSSMVLHNCTSLNDVSTKNGNVTVKNGSIVV